MSIEIGHVEAIFRYPVKSMAGERLDSAELGWHGLEGDRRFAFRRMEDRGGFPWLTASKLPELLRYHPLCTDGGALPTHVRTAEGVSLPIFSVELASEVGRRYGSPVQMMHFRHGIFDDASLSVIGLQTAEEIARLAEVTPDVRRFRPNIAVHLTRTAPFQENEWRGKRLSFGSAEDSASIAVTMHDIRCSVVNLDPDSAMPSPEVLKSIVRVNQNIAGIYGAVVRTGQIQVGQPVLLQD